MCALFLIAPSLFAQSNELDALEQQRQLDQNRAAELERQAQMLDREMDELRQSLIDAAGKVQDHEEELSAVEQTLDVLTEEEQSKAQALQEQQRQLRRTLAALQRIALQPSEALIAAPGSPVDTVRSAMLLRVAVPAIEDRAQLLRKELDDLALLRTRIMQERNDLVALTSMLSVERQRLTSLLERKRDLRAATTAEQKAAQEQAERLAAKAESLRDLLSQVERESAPQAAPRQTATLAPPPASVGRRLTSPIGGNRLYGFQPPGGPETESGRLAPRRLTTPLPAPEQTSPPQPPAEVVVLQPPAAQETPPVVESSQRAPAARLAALTPQQRPANVRAFPANPASLVVPARGRLVTRYGEPRDGQAAEGVVLATRTAAQVVAPFDGQVVYAGVFRGYGNILIIDHGGQYHTLLAGLEQIDAVTGQWVLAGEPIAVMGASQDSGPELYLELRHQGEPINPLPWLATTGDKVRG